MRERPILYSALMARATLAERKIKTRRVLKQATGPSLSVGIEGEPGVAELSWLYGDGPGHDVHETTLKVPCPYGKPGDRLWGRETFFAFGRWETRYSAKKRRDEWHFVDMTLECGHAYRYAADGDGLWPMPGRRQLAGATPGWWRRPAIFMPRAASRILLEITDVGVERLQEISEQDAMDEGFYQAVHESPTGIGQDVVGWYRSLWEQLNGPDSWTLNPWVWVVTFRRVRARDSSSITTKEIA